MFTARYGLNLYMEIGLKLVSKQHVDERDYGVLVEWYLQENRSIRRKTSHSATFSATNFTWTWDRTRASAMRSQRLTNAPYPSPSTRCSYQKDKRAKPGRLSKNNAFGNQESWNRNVVLSVSAQGHKLLVARHRQAVWTLSWCHSVWHIGRRQALAVDCTSRRQNREVKM